MATTSKRAAKPKPAKRKPINPTEPDLELDPDAWPKFEALVRSAAKMGHKPHDAKIAKAKPEREK